LKNRSLVKNSLSLRVKKSIVTTLLILWGVLTGFLIYESFFRYAILSEDTVNSCFVQPDGGIIMTAVGSTIPHRIIKVERSQAKLYINAAHNDGRCVQYEYGL
jgi:hypothetical protein